jgi:dTDP-4-dehydrorhamnose reductase
MKVALEHALNTSGTERAALLFGGAGMLAHELKPALERTGWTVRGLSSADGDITDAVAVDALIGRSGAHLVVNCAAFTHVDRAETEPAQAFAVNAEGAGNVARAAARKGATLIHFSTDYVFDGAQRRPYREDDPASPLGVYARSKLAGEQQVAAAGGRHYIVRTGELYGAHGRNFFDIILARAREGLPLRVVDDQVVAPTWTRELALQLTLLVEKGVPGIYHATADGEVSWFDAAQEALRLAGVAARLDPVSTVSYGSPTPRPPYSILAHDALKQQAIYRMRPWQLALAEWIGSAHA